MDLKSENKIESIAEALFEMKRIVRHYWEGDNSWIENNGRCGDRVDNLPTSYIAACFASCWIENNSFFSSFFGHLYLH